MIAALAATSAFALTASPASSASTLNLDGSVSLDAADTNPFIFLVTIDGSAPGAVFGGSAPYAGLNAQIAFTFAGSADAKNYTLDYTLANLSSGSNSGARIVTFGFDATGTPTITADSSPYDTNVQPGGSGFNGLGGRDMCFSAGNNNCNGGGGLKNGTILPGETFDGSLTFTYASATSIVTLDNFAVRFQSTGTLQGGSASGEGVVTAIPEPGTWALLIAGFGMIGTALRRRKSVLATA